MEKRLQQLFVLPIKLDPFAGRIFRKCEISKEIFPGSTDSRFLREVCELLLFLIAELQLHLTGCFIICCQGSHRLLLEVVRLIY